jgi:hypothetical protein
MHDTNGDPEVRDLLSEGERKHLDPRLAGSVGGQRRQRRERQSRRHHEHVTAAALEMRRGVLERSEHPVQVDVHDPLERLLVGLPDRA